MRIAVMGCSGSGKSTLARRLGERLNLPVVELDALNWGPDWFDRSKRDPDDFVRRVDDAIAGEAWVTDGNYSAVRPRILDRATRVVWLDYDRGVIMPRVLKRSFLRALSKDELWPGTGNREEFRRWLDKDHPIRWAWDTHKARRAGYALMFADPRLARISVHRLRQPHEAGALVEAWSREGLKPG
jgi:adenylate kinase family enzyme